MLNGFRSEEEGNAVLGEICRRWKSHGNCSALYHCLNEEHRRCPSSIDSKMRL